MEKIKKDKIIILTSAGMRIKDELFKIFPKPLNKIKVVQITTASMHKYKNGSPYVIRDKKIMEQEGIEVENIDLKNIKENELRKILAKKNIIYVQGGNTFYLLKYVKESGFDKIVRELIEQGAIYIGVSAGSYIACPNIEMAGWKDQDANIVDLKDLTAMNLVPFLMTVHYEDKYREAVIKGKKNVKYPVKILTNDQAILVKNDKIELIGKGKEIKI